MAKEKAPVDGVKKKTKNPPAGRNLDDIMNALPAKRQEKIRARSAQLKAEYDADG